MNPQVVLPDRKRFVRCCEYDGRVDTGLKLTLALSLESRCPFQSKIDLLCNKENRVKNVLTCDCPSSLGGLAGPLGGEKIGAVAGRLLAMAAFDIDA